MPRIKDLKGQRFNRFIVIEYVGINNNNRVVWLCKCDCGNFKNVVGHDLINNNVKSCGCLKKEKNKSALTKHGLTNTRIHTIWQIMKDRCSNPKSKDFGNYGGRGIKVCNEWLKDFMNFYNWSIENGYTENLSIDRVNVNGNYEPDNCRWATNKEQQNNRRNNNLVTINGITKTISQWADEMGIYWGTIKERLRRGDVGERLIRPIQKHKRGRLY